MTATFLDYLTLPNPNTWREKDQKGSNTKSSVVYGPDFTSQWEDLTWQNLEATFKDILQNQMMQAPPIRDSADISRENTNIKSEESLRLLGEAWQEPVLRHALEGTHALLSKAEPSGRFGRGTIHFESNEKKGCNRKRIPIVNQKGVKQWPDWYAYQKVPSQGQTFPHLVPGDCKPASKWKSDWILSQDPTLKRKAKEVLWQVTRYMWDAETRYSFILTEEELVPVRISVYDRDMDRVHEDIEKQFQTDQIDDSNQPLDEADEHCIYPGPGLRREGNPHSAYADDTRTTGIMLEWCRISWESSGSDTLTINLTLWWLLVLAVQETAIKKSGTYTALSEKTRGNSPSHDLKKTQDELLVAIYDSLTPQKKRRVDDDDTSDDSKDRASKIQKSTRAIDISISSSHRRSISTTPRASTPRLRGKDDGGVVSENASFTSSLIQSRPLRRSTRRAVRSVVDSGSECMSQVTDKPEHSFYSSA